jgi:hypothetical protein
MEITIVPEYAFDEESGWSGASVQVDGRQAAWVPSKANRELELEGNIDVPCTDLLHSAGLFKDGLKPHEIKDDWEYYHMAVCKPEYAKRISDALEEADEHFWELYYPTRAKEIVAEYDEVIDVNDSDAPVVLYHQQDFENDLDVYVCANEEDVSELFDTLSEGADEEHSFIGKTTMFGLLWLVENILREGAHCFLNIRLAENYLRERANGDNANEP